MGSRDWFMNHDDNLWQGVNGVNNPCPTGFRVPTEVEWTIELLNWETYDSVGAFGSVLKIPEAGNRDFQGNILFGYEESLFWTSTINVTRSRGLIIGEWGYEFFNGSRAEGFSVRCVKD